MKVCEISGVAQHLLFHWFLSHRLYTFLWGWRHQWATLRSGRFYVLLVWDLETLRILRHFLNAGVCAFWIALSLSKWNWLQQIIFNWALVLCHTLKFSFYLLEFPFPLLSLLCGNLFLSFPCFLLLLYSSKFRVLVAIILLVLLTLLCIQEDVKIVISAVVDLCSWILCKILLFALGKVPLKSQRGHDMLRIERAHNFVVVIASHCLLICNLIKVYIFV